MRLAQVEPVQQPVQRRSADPHHLLLRFRPAEFVFPQPFLPDAEAVEVPVEDFDDIPVSVAKGEEVSGEQIQAQFLFDDNGESIDRFAHIGGAQGDKDLHVILLAQHQSDSRVVISRPSRSPEKSVPISILNLSFCRLRVMAVSVDRVRNGTGTNETGFGC